jgi:hypothetical protein
VFEQVVRINGVTWNSGTAKAAGLLAQPSNSGRHSRDVFGLVPEAILRVGVDVSGGGRLFVGYNFCI